MPGRISKESKDCKRRKKKTKEDCGEKEKESATFANESGSQSLRDDVWEICSAEIRTGGQKHGVTDESIQEGGEQLTENKLKTFLE